MVSRKKELVVKKNKREIGGVEDNKGGSLTKIMEQWAGLDKEGVAK